MAENTGYPYDAPANETRAQREIRRKALRELREEAAKNVEPTGLAGVIAGSMGPGDADADADWVQGLLDAGEEEAAEVRHDGYNPENFELDTPDFNEQSKLYKGREVKGRLSCLSLFIRTFASGVEGVHILNPGFDDVTGEMRVKDPVFRLHRPDDP